MEDEITVNGEVYVRKDAIKEPFIKGEIKIVVLQRGWVVVGYMERNGNTCTLKKASVIRVWGTTKGLGEIAIGGPTSSTKLDKCNGLVKFDHLTMVLSIDCKEEAWKAAL